jgi:hypothetical protein
MGPLLVMNGAFFVAHLAPSMESAAAGAGGCLRLAVAQESAVWIPRRLLWPAAKAPSIPLGERAVDTCTAGWPGNHGVALCLDLSASLLRPPLADLETGHRLRLPAAMPHGIGVLESGLGTQER